MGVCTYKPKIDKQVWFLSHFAENADRGGFNYILTGPARNGDVQEVECFTVRSKADTAADIHKIMVHMHKAYYDHFMGKLPAWLLEQIAKSIEEKTK